MTVNLQMIQEARQRISPLVPETPVTEFLFLSDQLAIPVWGKLENLNLAGSFKIRGAANALLATSPEERERGVVAASAGNHAQGVAYTCRKLKTKATIFMPERTPLVKVSATRAHGANVVLTGHLYDDAFQAAQEYLSQEGGILIHPFAHPLVIAGQGTVGLEIIEQLPNIGLVVTPIGGGGLASGVACAMKEINPSIKVIGVQVKTFPAAKESVEKNTIIATSSALTIADGIAVKRPSEQTFAMMKKYIDEIILVDDDQIAAAIMDLMEKGHMLAEGAGAVSIAGLRSLPPETFKDLKGRSVCCIISGGNIDVNLFTRIANRGLVATGRLMRLVVRTKDQPGSLARILQAVSKTGANLLDLRHNRNFGALYYSDVDIEIDLETASFAHQKEIFQALEKLGVAYH